jgi:SPP1 family predicted phage head-tail adaptor
MICQTISKKKTNICTFDFDKKIAIKTSQKTADNSPNGETAITFTTIIEVWAMIKTKSGIEFFDGVNIVKNNNTDFYIRYNSAIDYTKQLFVDYNGNLYLINSIENIDKQDKIIKLRSTEKGSNTIQANYR